MFATLLGGLPRPIGPDGLAVDVDDAAVAAAIDAQAEAGLALLTDGRLRAPAFADAVRTLEGVVDGPDGLRLAALPRWLVPLTVDAWRYAANHASGPVKQALPGPYTLGRRLGAADVDAATAAFARALRSEVQALADASCAFIEIEEPDAHHIGPDDTGRRRFADAHRALLEGIAGVHLSLAITGGNADTAGIGTILGAPYASLAVDLIDGPDNWRLVTATPGDRGIVCGAMSSQPGSDDGPELLIWAASYAAASNRRGMERVGLATAGGLAALPWAVAVRKLTRLGNASRLASRPLAEAAPDLDPRALDIRSAALGRFEPPTRRPRPVRTTKRRPPTA